MAPLSYETYPDSLKDEARSFDKQILERIEHGHVPDLSENQRCEWFHSNIWRDPHFANLLYGRILDQLEKAIDHLSEKDPMNIKILEIACGPGHMCLELARRGYDVSGIDVSAECITVAKATAQNQSARLATQPKFRAGDFMSMDFDGDFDVVFFSCALHHFPDIEKTVEKVKACMKQGGVFFVSEPARFPLKKSEALLIHMFRALLSAGGAYYPDEFPLPNSPEELADESRKIQNEFGYVDEAGKNVQSAHDNEAGYDDIQPVLVRAFEEISVGFDFCFFDRIVGGLRLPSIEKERELATWMRLVDGEICAEGGFTPEQFHFTGRHVG